MPLPPTPADCPEIDDCRPPSGSPSSDADRACHCLDQLASECRLNPTAYQREGKEKIRKMESELKDAKIALRMCKDAMLGKVRSNHPAWGAINVSLSPENAGADLPPPVKPDSKESHPGG